MTADESAYDSNVSAWQPAYLTGKWISRYRYRSASRGEEFTDTHVIDLDVDGGQLVGRSLPHPSGSELTLALTVEGGVVSGTWAERTSPTGHYRAATFRGLIQLVIAPTGHTMSGMWLGVNKRDMVNAGQWWLERQLDGAVR